MENNEEKFKKLIKRIEKLIEIKKNLIKKIALQFPVCDEVIYLLTRTYFCPIPSCEECEDNQNYEFFQSYTHNPPYPTTAYERHIELYLLFVSLKELRDLLWKL